MGSLSSFKALQLVPTVAHTAPQAAKLSWLQKQPKQQKQPWKAKQQGQQGSKGQEGSKSSHGRQSSKVSKAAKAHGLIIFF